jgi:hypothetical protein
VSRDASVAAVDVDAWLDLRLSITSFVQLPATHSPYDSIDQSYCL